MDRWMAQEMARAANTSISRLGLRFDRVVLRTLSELTKHCDRVVPDKTQVLLTISAPIRLPARTVAELKKRIEGLLFKGSPPREQASEVNGNTIGLRVVEAMPGAQPRLLGLVHNAGTDPRFLLELIERYARGALTSSSQPARKLTDDAIVLQHAAMARPRRAL